MSTLVVPLSLALFFGGAFALNELGHGGLSEATGFGHHHLFDVGGYHCGPHDDSDRAERHRQHMHDPNAPVAHDGCPGGAHVHGHGSGMPRGGAAE